MPYLEDFSVGQVVNTPARTIYMHDITAFAYMSADWHQLHTDEEFARASIYGGILAHGPLVLVAAYGLMVRAGIFEEQAIGFLGLSWEMSAPVRPGDTISVQVVVQEVRASTTKPDRGVVTMQFTVSNQRNEAVASGTWKNLYRTRGEGG